MFEVFGRKFWTMCFPVRGADPVLDPQFDSLARDWADKEGCKMQVIKIAPQFIKHISKTHQCLKVSKGIKRVLYPLKGFKHVWKRQHCSTAQMCRSPIIFRAIPVRLGVGKTDLWLAIHWHRVYAQRRCADVGNGLKWVSRLVLAPWNSFES